MDASVSDDLAIFRDATRRFLEKEVAPHADLWRKEKRVPQAIWRKAGEAGLLCASMPDQYGGAGGDFRHEVVIVEELVRIGFLDFAIPLHNAVIVPYVQHYGSEEQKQRWMPKFASGELITAIAMTEPGAGSDLRGMRTKAVRDGENYVINGQKTFISNGQIANWICIAAYTEEDGRKGISLIAVETDQCKGLTRGRNLEKLGVEAQDTSELFFEDLRVPVANRLGEESGRGLRQLMAQLSQERLVVAVQAVAGIECAVEETIAYVKVRKAFGQSLVEFQNTQFVLADAKTVATVARSYLNDCVAKHLDGQLDAVAASMAKLWTTEQQSAVLDTCLQQFGGYGYMKEYPIARRWVDARLHRIYGGTSEIMKEIIARQL